MYRHLGNLHGGQYPERTEWAEWAERAERAVQIKTQHITLDSNWTYTHLYM